MADYDKDLINSRIIEVCDYYVPGEGRNEGYKRRKWDCPECGGDNFTANSEQEFAGCFSPSCDVPQTTDAIGIIAYFEDLGTEGKEFVQCLKRGYEVLGIPESEDDRRGSSGGSKASSGIASVKRSKSNQPTNTTGEDTAESDEASTATAAPPSKDEPETTSGRPGAETLQVSDGLTMPAANREQDGQPSREFTHRVYEAWMELCPLVEAHREFWHGRGVTDETIQKGGFGSLSQDRCRYVMSALREQFGMKDLLTVPGFKEGPNGELHTNLFGEFTLIPYYDREGYISTIEGRVPGEPAEGKPKYMAPINAGSHLYVFPGFEAQHVMAFCEGLVGAIVAAQNGIAVASIKGCRCYRRSPVGKGKPYRVLQQLEGVDFAERPVYYIPDLDVKEKTRAAVEKAAPEAAKWLIEKQNGKAYIARLPEDGEDLDTWLLSLDERERVTEFVKLTQTAISPKQWKGENEDTSGSESFTGADRKDGDRSEDDNGASGRISKHSSGTETEDEEQTEESEDGNTRRSSIDEKRRREYDEERKKMAAQQKQESTAPKTPEPEAQPNGFKEIPKTNFGEFMVALIYGAVAGLAFCMIVLFALPELEPTSFTARVPAPITIIVGLIITAWVLRYMVRRQYVRRWWALKNHLAGKQ